MHRTPTRVRGSRHLRRIPKSIYGAKLVVRVRSIEPPHERVLVPDGGQFRFLVLLAVSLAVGLASSIVVVVGVLASRAEPKRHRSSEHKNGTRRCLISSHATVLAS